MSGSNAADPPVLTARAGHVLLVTLNRPEVHNAVDHRVAALLGEAVEGASEDPDVWALVLTGAGGRAFSAGADLKAMVDGATITAPGHQEWGFAGFVKHFTPVPVIAAVEGWALGGGTEICLACDIVVAGDTARFGLPEVHRGIIPGGGGLLRLVAQIPEKRALQLIYTGEQIAAADACMLGLVNEVVPAGTALRRALEIAEQICANAPLAVQAAKRVARRHGGPEARRETERWDESDRERLALATTEDAREGIAAFVEKRRPRWRAR